MKAIIHRLIALRWTDAILALDLAAPPEAAAARAYVTTETILSDAPLSRLDGLPDYRSRESLEERRRRGDACVVARRGKRIVGFAWLAAGSWGLRDAALQFRLDPTEAVVYDIFTAAEYRGRGIMQHLLRRVAEVARAQGHRRLFARAELDNSSSIAAMEHAGFVQLAWITTLRVGVFMRFHTIDIAKDQDTFRLHARRHLRATRPALLRWRTGMPVHLPTNAGGR
jgi:GNAT superfamily N-acetyltransferase